MRTKPDQLPASARRIREYQERHGTPTAALARRAGVSRMTMHNWRDGINKPQVDKLSGLAQVLGCDVSELLD